MHRHTRTLVLIVCAAFIAVFAANAQSTSTDPADLPPELDGLTLLSQSDACQYGDIMLFLDTFQEEGVVRLSLWNTTDEPTVLQGFDIRWPNPEDHNLQGVLRLHRVVIGGENADDWGQPDSGGQRVWEGDDAIPSTAHNDPSTTFWETNHVLPANTTLPVYLDFAGTDTYIYDAFGVSEFDFTNKTYDTTFQWDCEWHLMTPAVACHSSESGRGIAFHPNGVVQINIRNHSLKSATITGFSVRWPNPANFGAEGVLRLQRIVVGGESTDDWGQPDSGGQRLWEGDDSYPHTFEDDLTTTFFDLNVIVPPVEAVPIYLDFAGTDSDLNTAFGVELSNFYSSFYLLCGEDEPSPTPSPTHTSTPTFGPSPTPTLTDTPTTTVSVSPSVSPSPTPCSYNDVALRFGSFEPFGVVRMEVENTTNTPQPLNAFVVLWPDPADFNAEGVLRLQRVTIGGADADDWGAPDSGGTRIWEGDDPVPYTAYNDPSTTFWKSDYVLPANSTLPIYIDFAGTASDLNTAFGIEAYQFNGTRFSFGCEDFFVPSPTPTPGTPTSTPVCAPPTSTPLPTYTPVPTDADTGPIDGAPLPHAQVIPTCTPAPTATPTDPTPTATPEASLTMTATPTSTASLTPSLTISPTATQRQPTPSATATATPPAHPTNLHIEGVLDVAPVLPTFHWRYDSAQPILWQHLYVIADDGTVIVNEWYQSQNICTGDDCIVTPDSVLPSYGLSNGGYQWWVGIYLPPSVIYSGGPDFTPATFAVTMPALTLNEANFAATEDGLRLLLTWDDMPNMLWYHIGVASDDYSTMGWYAGEDVCTDGACRLLLDVPAGRYYAWMQAWGPNGYASGPLGNGWIEAAGTPVRIGSTASGTGLPTDVTFSGGALTWMSGANATYYEVYITTTDYSEVYALGWSSDIALGCNALGATCTLPLDVTLVDGTDYKIYIQTWGPNGLATGGLTDAPSYIEADAVYTP